jgi:hypothetical protein
LRALQCRNGTARDIARALGLVSGALRWLEGLELTSEWLEQSGGPVFKRCVKTEVAFRSCNRFVPIARINHS